MKKSFMYFKKLVLDIKSEQSIMLGTDFEGEMIFAL